ncbi:hypothetical protein [Natrinema marinum]|uniref:hypothetical protein n=1 Tax=Natrinema marinum TaxID=2961598 RepID=UPI0020C8AFF3|nr:hypothetical protein [Natrinema marinum]
MAANKSGPTESGSAQTDAKRFLVQCDGCSFERSADGREEATRIGTHHRRETGHEIVAVELPPSADSA